MCIINYLYNLNDILRPWKKCIHHSYECLTLLLWKKNLDIIKIIFLIQINFFFSLIIIALFEDL